MFGSEQFFFQISNFIEEKENKHFLYRNKQNKKTSNKQTQKQASKQATIKKMSYGSSSGKSNQILNGFKL